MKNKARNLSSAIIAAILITMMIAMNAFAAAGDLITVTGSNGDEIRYTEGIIDENMKTSLAVYKYNYNGENPTTGDAHYTSVLPEGAVPLKGVTFTYYRIADLVQETDGSQTVGLKFKVNEAAAGALKITAGEYTSDELTEVLKGFTADGAEDQKWTLEDWVEANGTAMPATDENGKSKVESLDQGLYLIAETDVPSDVTVRCDPFLVSLPMTNVADVAANGNTYVKGTLWQYDVTVQPKNKVEKPDIDKEIIDGDNSDKFDNIGIGDTVTYQIRADIPNHIPKMSKYNISDKMSAGLTFQGIQSIQVDGTDITGMNMLTPGLDGATFTLEFIHGDTNALAAYPGKEVLITYTAILNENAIVTEEGNPNEVKLDYNHNSSSDSKDSTVEPIKDPVVYTYGIDLMKVDENGNPLAGVEFELYLGDKTTLVTVTEKLSSNPAYADVRSYYPNKNSQDTKIITGANGKAYIYGLAPGVYYLKETKAAPNHNLLPDPIKVEIKEELTYTESAEQGTYLKLPAENVPQYYRKRFNGEYVPFVDLSSKAGEWVNFGTNQVYVLNGDTYTQVEGLCVVTAKANVDVAAPFGASGMNVLLKIQNDSSFKLPETGGVGTYIFVAGGIIIALAAVGLILVNRKKRAGR